MLSQLRELILFRTCLFTHRFAERTRDRAIIFGPFCSLSISSSAGRPNFPRPPATIHRLHVPQHWRLRCSLWLKWLFYTGIRHRYHHLSQLYLKIWFSKNLSAFHHSSARGSIAVVSVLHLISSETIIGHFVLSVKSICMKGKTTLATELKNITQMPPQLHLSAKNICEVLFIWHLTTEWHTSYLQILFFLEAGQLSLRKFVICARLNSWQNSPISMLSLPRATSERNSISL